MFYVIYGLNLIYLGLSLFAAWRQRAQLPKELIVLFSIACFLALVSVGFQKQTFVFDVLMAGALILAGVARPLVGRKLYGSFHLSHLLSHATISLILYILLLVFQ